MKARSTKLTVEVLEDRDVPSTVIYDVDFNKDGLKDMAAITGQKTITVSLGNLDGSYTVSATLTAPKPIVAIEVTDLFAGDGNPDIHASGSKSSDNFYWFGNGDGTFNYLEPFKSNPRTFRGF